MNKSVSFISVLALLAVYSFMPGASHAAAPYYEGKSIEILGESRVGGGTDTMARIIAAAIPKHIPSHPKIVVRSLPGGGWSIANNIVYAKGKPDGLHLMMNSSSPIALQLQGRDIVKYDLTKLEMIGNISRGSNLLMVSKSALKRLTDRNAKPVICGTKEGEEAWIAMTLWGSEFLGWNIRWIPGYSGTSDMEEMSKDSQFDKLVRSMVTDVYQVNVGQDTEDLLKEILSAPPAALEYWANLQKKYGVIAAK